MSLSLANLSSNKPPIKLVVVDDSEIIRKAMASSFATKGLNGNDFVTFADSTRLDEALKTESEANLLVLSDIKQSFGTGNTSHNVGKSLESWRKQNEKNRNFMLVLHSGYIKEDVMPSASDQFPINTTEESKLYSLAKGSGEFDANVLKLIEHFGKVIKQDGKPQ